MEIYNDFNTSVKKALDEIDPKHREYGGIVICGTHSLDPETIAFHLARIKEAREGRIPFLGICFGHQLAAIEYAQNVLGHKNATSEEYYLSESRALLDNAEFIVRKRPEGLKVGLHDGESYWNNYEIVPGFEDMWDKADNFITCQYHPEYQSSKDNPHPLLVKFLKECKKHGNAE